MSGANRTKWIVCLALLGITLGLYWPATHFEFTSYDDLDYVTENPQVLGGVTIKNLQWAFTTTHAANWHPITWISHMMDVEFHGMNAGRHHLTNILLHCANAGLIFWLLLRLSNKLWLGIFVAALFAWHPAHVESVAWIAERKDVLSTFFGLCALLSYLSYAQTRSWFQYVAATRFLALSLMAKPMLVTLPILLLLLDFWPLKRLDGLFSNSISKQSRLKSIAGLLLEKLPFFALAGVSGVMTIIAQQNSGAIVYVQQLPLHARVQNAVVSYVKYVGMLVWPQDLAIPYPFPNGLPLWQVIGSGLLLTLISIMVYRSARNHPVKLVGWSWFIVTLIPVIGLLQVGGQAMADRYTYVPSIGLFLLLGWWAFEYAANASINAKRILGAICGLMLGCCLWLTTQQLQHWRNSYTLFSHAVKVTKGNAIAHYNLGLEYLKRGDGKEALKHSIEAARLAPTFDLAFNNAGLVLLNEGKFEEAKKWFQQALQINPGNSIAHCNLGLAFAGLGDWTTATSHYQTALELEPDNPTYRCRHGQALGAQGQSEAAIAEHEIALKLNSEFAASHAELGVLFAGQGRTSEALQHYREACRLKPDDTTVLNNLAWLLATCSDASFRNGAEAVQFAERACVLTSYKIPVLLGTRAAALAEAGRFSDAVLSADKAQELALLANQPEIARKNKELAELYRAGKAYQEVPTDSASK